jgi:hypothetical protein
MAAAYAYAASVDAPCCKLVILPWLASLPDNSAALGAAFFPRGAHHMAKVVLTPGSAP